MSLSPPCQSGALSTSSTTFHTSSIEASISATDEPVMAAMTAPLLSLSTDPTGGDAPARTRTWDLRIRSGCNRDDFAEITRQTLAVLAVGSGHFRRVWDKVRDTG